MAWCRFYSQKTKLSSLQCSITQESIMQRHRLTTSSILKTQECKAVPLCKARLSKPSRIIACLRWKYTKARSESWSSNSVAGTLIWCLEDKKWLVVYKTLVVRHKVLQESLRQLLGQMVQLPWVKPTMKPWRDLSMESKVAPCELLLWLPFILTSVKLKFWRVKARRRNLTTKTSQTWETSLIFWLSYETCQISKTGYRARQEKLSFKR